jgi:uncharacterized protein (TIGR02646 family)
VKKITKKESPEELKQWRRDNAQTPQNLYYGLAEFPHEDALKALLKEQGNICAYTLKRICPTSAHIEHLKPQKTCKAEDKQRESNNTQVLREDIAWENMVACFPEPNPPAPPDYGAVKKDKWWNEEDFISPLHADCEQRFQFTPDGKVATAKAGDNSATTTIKTIGLDNPKLGELRHAAYIRAGIHRRSENPIRSIQKIEQLIAKWSNRDATTDSFSEFCIPLAQVAKDYAQFLRSKGVK